MNFMSKIGQPHKAIIILKKPRVTEKATLVAGAHLPVYTFEVASSANKLEISRAIKERFKVTPDKIRIINLPAKRMVRRGLVGYRSGLKKAMVYLKAGETIDII